MPRQAPFSSTTGTRRTWLSSITWQQSSTLISGVTVTQGLDMQSPAVISSGFLPTATVRQVMSRSVITPTSFILCLLWTTGLSPQSCSTISRATSCRLESVVQQAGFLVIISLTCMVLLLRYCLVDRQEQADWRIDDLS